MTRHWLVMAVFAIGCGSTDEPESIPKIETGPSEQVQPEHPFPELANSCSGDSCRSFCAPETWGGEVPTVETDAVIADGQTVVVDCEAKVGTLTIEPGGALVASRNVDSRLDVHGNLIVRGLLNYGTVDGRVSSDVRAEVVFHPPPDDQYVGTPTTAPDGTSAEPSVSTPMEVVPSDHGLWVVGEGRFFAAGGVKSGWARLHDSAGADDTTFDVDDVTGWRRGDRLAFAPTQTGDDVGFEESLIREINGTTVVIEGGLQGNHQGCADCFRRGEVLNLTRNVVFRSYDDTSHAHVMVADRGVARLDSVELRWLGPRRCDRQTRRAAIYFHQQDDASRESNLRHVAIWGGEREFVVMERSHGVSLDDVVGYDGRGDGFVAMMDRTNCGADCTDVPDSIPLDSRWTGVVAAKVAGETAPGCPASQRVSGFVLPGEGGGCIDCVAAAIGDGELGDGFRIGEDGGLPDVLHQSVAHHNAAHGFVFSLADVDPGHPYDSLIAYSNGGHGVHWGAEGNAVALSNYVASDNAASSLGLRAVPLGDHVRVEGATVDDVRVLPSTAVAEEPTVMVDLQFTGSRGVGVTQTDEACPAGTGESADDPDCPRTWIRLVDPVFAEGMQPFLFADTPNRHTVWEIRGFSDPAYPDLPVDFDLHRRDAEIDGGYLHSGFDAWLVPR